MTRSIFDPTGGETEHSGSRLTPPTADNNSHMPPDIVDGGIPDIVNDKVPDMEFAEGDPRLGTESQERDRGIGQTDEVVDEMGTKINLSRTLKQSTALPPRRANEGG